MLTLADQRYQTTLDCIWAALRPEPILSVSEWSNHHRILPSKGAAEPGPWRTSRTPYLQAIMDALSTGSPYHTVVFAKGSQIGAPLDVDTPIPTPTGWKRMGGIRPGDNVFGSDGQVATVLGVSPTYHDRECYRVMLSDGESVVADAEHRWTVDRLTFGGPFEVKRYTLTTGRMYAEGGVYTLPLLHGLRDEYRQRLNVRHTVFQRRNIVGVVPVPSVPVCCIAVGTPDHLFLAGRGMIATHNSEAGLNWVGYCIHHAPAPILMVQPTLDMVKRISKQRIQPMIDVTPALTERVAQARTRDTGNTLFQKEFPGGTFVMTGANSATGLRSMPARYLFLDEVDAYPGDVEGEGDPVDLAIARTSTFKRNRKIYLCSTPTIAGFSRIWKAFEATDQRYYLVPCPHCGHYQTIDWTRIVWPEGKPREAALTCEACGSLIDEHHKGRMLAQGEWRATAEAQASGVIGFHLSSLYSPPGWYSWGDAAEDFLAAKAHPTKLQSFINTKLGQCWEDRSGESVDAERLLERREIWTCVPGDVCLLTAGVDVQDDRLEVTIIGFTGMEQARVLHHYQLWGSPGAPEVWTELDAILTRQHQTADGRMVRVQGACVDSGGHHTQRAYEFCRTRVSRKVMPVKGKAGAHPVWPLQATKTELSRGVRLYHVGVDTAKDQIRSALSVGGPDLPRYVSFSDELPDEYFKQLTSEKRRTKTSPTGVLSRVWYKPPGVRNEALDCYVYAYCALEMLKQQGVRLRIVAARSKLDTLPGEAMPPSIPRPQPYSRRTQTSSAIR